MNLSYIILGTGSKADIAIIMFLVFRPAGANPLTYLVQTWAEFGGWTYLTRKTIFSKNRTIVSTFNAKIPKKIITFLAIIPFIRPS